MTQAKLPLSYRAFYPHQHIPDTIYGPVLAYSTNEAIAALQCDAMHLQRMQNGTWVWNDSDGPTGA